MPTSVAGPAARRAGAVAGLASGLLLVLAIGGAWLVLGNPLTWPAALAVRVQERRGEQIYDANCLSCHLGPRGGGINDVPPRHNANGHTWHHPDCALQRMTREGSEAVFGRTVEARSEMTMPAFKDRLSADEIDAALAYIRTMWTPAQRQAQAMFTRQMCFD